MSGGEVGDARPNIEDEKCGRGDRAQNDVVLRNVGGGEEGSGSVVTTVTLFFLFFFFFLFFLFFFLILLIYCFYRGKMHNCAHPTVLGTRVLGWNVSHVDQNLQLQSFPLSPS